jgi:hypothetical protein
MAASTRRMAGLTSASITSITMLRRARNTLDMP